jgi:hypothetical protein
MVLEDLVREVIPKVSDKLATLSIDLASITFGWFLSLFTDCLPVEVRQQRVKRAGADMQTLFRVWDVFFVEGRDVGLSPTAVRLKLTDQSLYRIAIAILKSNEQDILGAETVSDLFSVISGMTSRLWAADKLISVSPQTDR